MFTVSFVNKILQTQPTLYKYSIAQHMHRQKPSLGFGPKMTVLSQGPTHVMFQYLRLLAGMHRGLRQ